MLMSTPGARVVAAVRPVTLSRGAPAVPLRLVAIAVAAAALAVLGARGGGELAAAAVAPWRSPELVRVCS